MFKPDCKNPILLFNQFVFTMLANGGTLYILGKRVVQSLHLPVKTWLSDARNYTDEDLDNCYCVCGDMKENAFVWVPCMHCELCFHSKQYDLINRSILETQTWSCPPYFFTLTYKPSELPYTLVGNKRIHHGNLQYKDVQDFFKRLRQKWKRKGLEHDVRYLVAGEYGKKGRAHYHVLLWNNPYNCNELQPLLHNQLKDDIFTAWGKCELQAFDFGQCRGGAAPYATKYVTKPKETRGHIVKPFIHCSAGSRGGLGSIFLYQYLSYLRSNPSVNYLEYVDKKGGYNYMFFTRSINKKVWPSVSSLVPYKLRDAWRQLVDATVALVQCGVPLDDLRPLLDVLRPYGCHFRFRKKVFDTCHCHLYRVYYITRYMTIIKHLADILVNDYDIDNEYISLLYKHKSMLLPKNNVDLGQKSSKIRETIAIQNSKETLL